MTRNQHTWTDIKPTWRNGKTTTIRVPIALVDEVRRYAIALDQDKYLSIDSALTQFLDLKKTQHRRAGMRWNSEVPTWRIFNEFRRWLDFHSD